MSKLGNWISGKTQTPFYARREFYIEKPLQKATAYVCGLGQFIFHIIMAGKYLIMNWIRAGRIMTERFSM